MHVKLTIKSTAKKAAQYCFEIQKFNFAKAENITQLVPSTSHFGLHLAFNQAGKSVSFYDYTMAQSGIITDAIESMWFPGLINYLGVDKEILIAVLQVEGDTIKVIKEVEPGMWLVFLERDSILALYNIATNALIKCKFDCDLLAP